MKDFIIVYRIFGCKYHVEIKAKNKKYAEQFASMYINGDIISIKEII